MFHQQHMYSTALKVYINQVDACAETILLSAQALWIMMSHGVLASQSQVETLNLSRICPSCQIYPDTAQNEYISKDIEEKERSFLVYKDSDKFMRVAEQLFVCMFMYWLWDCQSTRTFA